ncbi:MAG: hypothetical protein JW957_04295 [Candidatus Omnitrophica bacterium]|nr:hypothetical protein [Candidatus Omnitrophota bacterium]
MVNFKKKHPDFRVYEKSANRTEGGETILLAEKDNKKFVVSGKEDFRFQPAEESAAFLRGLFPWLRAKPCGLKNSFGFGDRLGTATPGHIRALKNHDFFPVFAQQSVREIERTGRSFQKVMDAAATGCFQEGYKGGFGADADHIKDLNNMQKALSAGFTFFTLDSSDKIRNPEKLKGAERQKILQKYSQEYEKAYLGRKYPFGGIAYEFTKDELQNLVLTYAESIDYIEECYRFLKARSSSFDFEVSVDETPIPTTPLAHILIADTLRERGVEVQSLAFRFPGSFEKGIDYKGDAELFERDLAAHQSIREKAGNYKISLHSGSDKFSVYPAFKKILGDKIHVKTAGTSWVEAVKVIAEKNFPLFLEILECGITNFEKHAASYEISAKPELIDMKNLKNTEVAALFADNNIRQVVHISYGTILSEEDSAGRFIYRNRFFEVLNNNEELYYGFLEAHLGKHLELLK